MTGTVYASFSNPAEAERAAGALLDYGAHAEDLSYVAPEGYGGQPGTAPGDASLAPRAGAGASDQAVDDPVAAARIGISTTTPEDAAVGALEGASTGLQIGAIAALATLWVPGFGVVVGGAALVEAIGAMAATAAAGALAGGVFGYLKDQGVPEPHAAEYHATLQSGGAVLALRVPSGKVDAAAAESVLRKYQAARVGFFAPLDGPPGGASAR